MSQCFMFNVNQFVWIDETGSDARDQSRKHGYSLRGQAPVVYCHTGQLLCTPCQ